MGFGIIDTSTLTAIANAIRTKLGVQTTYKPSEMATAIGQISSGDITPTGTKQISITANGTTTEDVTAYADVEISVNVAGGASGLEYEEGTYTAVSDGNPTINFTNAHASAPALVIFMDTGAYVNQLSGVAYDYIGFDALFGSGPNVSESVERPAMFAYGRIGSNGTAAFGGKPIGTVSDHVTNTGFTPNFDSTSVTCKSGRAYKWIAIWK